MLGVSGYVPVGQGFMQEVPNHYYDGRQDVQTVASVVQEPQVGWQTAIVMSLTPKDSSLAS